MLCAGTGHRQESIRLECGIMPSDAYTFCASEDGEELSCLQQPVQAEIIVVGYCGRLFIIQWDMLLWASLSSHGDLYQTTWVGCTRLPGLEVVLLQEINEAVEQYAVREGTSCRCSLDCRQGENCACEIQNVKEVART